jgi:hypothetical protein
MLVTAPPTPLLTGLLAAVQPVCEIMLNRISGIEQRGDEFTLVTLVLSNDFLGTAW